MEIRNRQRSRDWEAILAEHAESGLSASRFCKARGIRPSSYFSAKKRQRIALAMSTAAGMPETKTVVPTNQRVGIVASAKQNTPFVSVQVSDGFGDCASSDTAIRVQLRSGHQLWIASGFDAVHLGRLVAVLESAS